MKTHDVLQGSKEWLTLRSSCDGSASELSAAAGKSKYQSRTELLNQKLTGITPDIDDHKQRLFDRGHAAEELARAIAEGIICEDLYPTTATIEIDGLILLASFDGVTADDSIIFEHKLYNKSLSDDVKNGALDEHYTLQMDHQLLVSGAEKCLFMCSDGTKENMSWCWYMPEQDNLDNVVRVWGQFRKDLCRHTLSVEEAPVADAIISLPSVIVQVKGELTACNFNDIRKDWDEFIANAVSISDLSTDFELFDENFDRLEALYARADAESKEARSTAKKCLAVVKGVIDQTLSISEVTRELELYAAKFNALALQQEKAVKSQKEVRKMAIMTVAKSSFAEHLKALELEILPIRLITGQPDFNGAMKNKRLLSAIQDAVDTELSRVKIESDSIAKSIRNNLAVFNVMAINHKLLFPHLQHLVYETSENFKLIVSTRIEAQVKAEAERLEAQRLQMQRDEESKATRKAEAEQAEKLEAERKKVRDEETAPLQLQDDRPVIIPNVELEKITILVSEYDALKADSKRLHAIISNWQSAKQMNESALRASTSEQVRNDKQAAINVRQKAIDLIELK